MYYNKIKKEREQEAIRNDITMLQKLEVLPVISGKRVLDLGCGDGHPTAVLKEFGADVVGLEVNRKEIGIGIDNGYIQKKDVVLADAKEIPFKENGFDMIFGFHIGSLSYYQILQDHYISPHWENILNKCVKSLKPQGTIFLSYHLGETNNANQFFSKIGLKGIEIARHNNYNMGLADTIYVGQRIDQ